MSKPKAIHWNKFGPSKKDVVALVTEGLRSGLIITASKTRPAHYGGRNTVTVGPYANAVTDNQGRWALISTGRSPLAHWMDRQPSASAAAHAFVTFIGNQRALDAYREAQRRNA